MGTLPFLFFSDFSKVGMIVSKLEPHPDWLPRKRGSSHRNQWVWRLDDVKISFVLSPHQRENEERDRRVSRRTCSYGLSKFGTVTSCFVIKFCIKTFHLSKTNTRDFQHLFGFYKSIFYFYRGKIVCFI